MDFPIHALMVEQARYHRLLGILYPDGLSSPRCGGSDLGVH